MHWNWKESFKLNAAKIIGHNAIEYSWLGSWYIALEGDPSFWIVGIVGAVVIHFVVFNILDVFHDHHTHKHKTPIFIATVMSMDCRDGKHFSCTYGEGCHCICHHPDT